MKQNLMQQITKTHYMTVVFPIQGDQVLLARKAGKVGKGCFNGYGGNIETGERILECTARELQEESSVIANMKTLLKVGFMKIRRTKKDGSLSITNLHILTVTDWEGEFKESSEMTEPTWFDIDKLPVDQMMSTDMLWLPQILKGQTVKGEIYIDERNKSAEHCAGVREHCFA